MKFQLERIALFSDAVFAIAITLMMIEIKAPHLAHGISFVQSFEVFSELFKIFIGTILSFCLIGMFWKKHHQLMKYMVGYNQKVLTMNISLLLAIAFIPFSTSFMFENFSVHTPLPLIVYNINYIVATLFNYRLFHYVLNPENKLTEDGNLEEMRVLKRETIFQIGIYVLVIIFAVITPHYAALGYALLALEDKWTNKGKTIKPLPKATSEQPPLEDKN